MENNDEKRDFLSIPQAAKILGISRIAVYKKVKEGKIKSVKIGRQFAIPATEISANIIDVTGSDLSEKEKQDIHEAVRKTVKEYGEVLDLLGKE